MALRARAPRIATSPFPATFKETLALHISAARDNGATLVAQHALYTLGLLELSLGRPAEAAAFYRQMPADGWSRLSYWAGGRAALDAVEAFAAIGDVESAREIAANLPEDARERPAAERDLWTLFHIRQPGPGSRNPLRRRPDQFAPVQGFEE